MAITDKKIIVITGASRSGTTLLSFILRNNAQVFGLKELHFFGDVWNPEVPAPQVSRAALEEAVSLVFARQSAGVLAARMTADTRLQAHQLVDSLQAGECSYADAFMAAVSKLASDAGKSIPCLQTPRNIFYAEALLQIFPAAHIVHIVRDPRGVMASQKRRWQRRHLANEKSRIPFLHMVRVWVNYHPYTVAKLWFRATAKARSLIGRDRFTLIRFEDLLREPEGTLRKLCASIGIRFEPAMLDVGQINSSHQSSVHGARKGINPATIDAWRGILTPAECALTEELCSDLMQEFGYIREYATYSSGATRLWYGLSYIVHLLGVVLVNPRRAWIQMRALWAVRP
jgi:hypothetical protein